MAKSINDEEFIRGKVPMTKQEIRILTLAKAGLERDFLLADIGAGTGSISCEACLHVPEGRVFALEQNPEAIELIKQNKAKFALNNLEIIEAKAPEKMEELPMLNAIIIGGSGNRLEEILDLGDSHLLSGGKFVINCITLQTLNRCISYFKERKAYEYEVLQVQVTRWEKCGAYDMAKANNPIFIITAEKKEM